MFKGISSFISAAIIILITISLGVLVSQWIVTVSKERTEDISSTTKYKLACEYAGIYIDNVTYDCSSTCAAGTAHNITVKVVNSGQKSLSISKIYVTNTTGNLFTLNVNETKTIEAGTFMNLINISLDTCSGINGSIDKVSISSMNCSETAHDEYPGSSVSYVSC